MFDPVNIRRMEKAEIMLKDKAELLSRIRMLYLKHPSFLPENCLDNLNNTIESIIILSKNMELGFMDNPYYIENINMSVRLLRVLRHQGIKLIFECENYTKKQAMTFRNAGKKSIAELEQIMNLYNVKFKTEIPN